MNPPGICSSRVPVGKHSAIQSKNESSTHDPDGDSLRFVHAGDLTRLREAFDSRPIPRIFGAVCFPKADLAHQVQGATPD